MKILQTLFCLFSLVSSTYSQGLAARLNESQEKVIQILTRAKEAVSKKRKVSEIRGLIIKRTSLSQDSSAVKGEKLETEIFSEQEIDVELPDRIRFRSESVHKNLFRGKEESNQSKSEFVLNEDRYAEDIGAFVDGQRVGLTLRKRPKEQAIAILKRQAFEQTFPLMFNPSWYAPLEYNYVGIVESKQGRFEVIEATLPDRAKYRFFFDAATYLLVQMTESEVDENSKPYEAKYYFSGYQEKDGLLVATKISSERVGEGGDRETSEITVKDVKINPTFKPNFFVVKE